MSRRESVRNKGKRYKHLLYSDDDVEEEELEPKIVKSSVQKSAKIRAEQSIKKKKTRRKKKSKCEPQTQINEIQQCEVELNPEANVEEYKDNGPIYSQQV